MIVFYSQADTLRMGRRAKISLFLSCALIVSALIVCIALCMRVNTGNAERMLYTVIGLFTLAGWIAILLFRLVYLPSAAGYRHMKSILCGEETEMEGTLTLTPAAFQIPKGILARKVKLADLRHNSDLSRIDRFTDHMFERIAKYNKAIKLLSEHDQQF